MAIFNSYVTNYQKVINHGYPWFSLIRGWHYPGSLRAKAIPVKSQLVPGTHRVHQISGQHNLRWGPVTCLAAILLADYYGLI